jgi:hypothetical protein
MVVDESLSFSDLIDRERFEVFNEYSLLDEDFFPGGNLRLFVNDFESFFDDFCVCLVE